MSTQQSMNVDEVVHFAAIRQVWFAETDRTNPVPRFLPCHVLLIEMSPGQFTLLVLTKSHRREIAQVSATLTTGWNICDSEAGYEVKWSASALLGLPGVGRYMHLRFDDPVVYWDFKCRFADACFQTCRRARELKKKLNQISNFEVFNRYAGMYLGEEYFQQPSEQPLEVNMGDSMNGAGRDAVYVKGEDGSFVDANADGETA